MITVKFETLTFSDKTAIASLIELQTVDNHAAISLTSLRTSAKKGAFD